MTKAQCLGIHLGMNLSHAAIIPPPLDLPSSPALFREICLVLREPGIDELSKARAIVSLIQSTLFEGVVPDDYKKLDVRTRSSYPYRSDAILRLTEQEKWVARSSHRALGFALIGVGDFWNSPELLKTGNFSSPLRLDDSGEIDFFRDALLSHLTKKTFAHKDGSRAFFGFDVFYSAIPSDKRGDFCRAIFTDEVARQALAADDEHFSELHPLFFKMNSAHHLREMVERFFKRPSETTSKGVIGATLRLSKLGEEDSRYAKRSMTQLMESHNEKFFEPLLRLVGHELLGDAKACQSIVRDILRDAIRYSFGAIDKETLAKITSYVGADPNSYSKYLMEFNNSGRFELVAQLLNGSKNLDSFHDALRSLAMVGSGNFRNVGLTAKHFPIFSQQLLLLSSTRPKLMKQFQEYVASLNLPSSNFSIRGDLAIDLGQFCYERTKDPRGDDRHMWFKLSSECFMHSKALLEKLTEEDQARRPPRPE